MELDFNKQKAEEDHNISFYNPLRGHTSEWEEKPL